jgi:predicted enzyme related to lactoylglutathione lyase|tara:strand:- start:501 stop:878 length:378 start_codon:yes stop_codon:yes gene_type:complete
MKASRYIYFTDNVGRLVSFYRDVMGMEVIAPPEAMDFDEEGWVQLASGGFEIGIHRAGKPGSSGRNRNKLVFLVDDVDTIRERLMKQGIRMGKLHTNSKCCDFKDPDGNILQISSIGFQSSIPGT